MLYKFGHLWYLAFASQILHFNQVGYFCPNQWWHVHCINSILLTSLNDIIWCYLKITQNKIDYDLNVLIVKDVLLILNF